MAKKGRNRNENRNQERRINSASRIGDRLTGRYGNAGTVTAIAPHPLLVAGIGADFDGDVFFGYGEPVSEVQREIAKPEIQTPVLKGIRKIRF